MKKILVFVATLVLFLYLVTSASAASTVDCQARGLAPGSPQFAACLAETAPASSGQTKAVDCPTGDFNRLCTFTTAKFGGIVGLVINFILVVATVIALFYLIYGGIKWITSEGDKGSLETARNHIVSAIVGLIVIFLAYFIMNVLLGFFIGKSIQDLQLPELKLP